MPRRVRTEDWLGPAGLDPPAWARIRRRKSFPPYLKKIKYRGGGICAIRTKHGIAPNIINNARFGVSKKYLLIYYSYQN